MTSMTNMTNITNITNPVRQKSPSGRPNFLTFAALLHLLCLVDGQQSPSSSVFGLLSQQHRPISRYGISVERLWSSALSGGSIDKSGGDSIEELADENIASSGRGLNVRGGAVHHVKDTPDLQSYFSSHPDSLIIIDFTASWCGPCQMVAPYYEELSEAFPDVIFLKVDVDECQDIAMQYDVSAMPTFVFLKGGEVVDRMMGANLPRLKEMLEEL
eukprot:CAMPEP_0113308042 /NCGR_PEP_ID=MMETSP0010_2-20120614/6639_1 /TAXON_ID=216773 ORGANISM="Corethron hystrix, Strain 308" /NCGR_SAMPLE_ID=MMETSP0010_2 /ASSEMBLY_ACC=CAM_ASM_000155 /LENGTH=214 /DNA_ID=CAMNT_0000163005 /DNA_START=139 /DNA_END=783 /DNA_ORIENTATION=+ /assembly_acc=CAM_ASM_000155